MLKWENKVNKNSHKKVKTNYNCFGSSCLGDNNINDLQEATTREQEEKSGQDGSNKWNKDQNCNPKKWFDY